MPYYNTPLYSLSKEGAEKMTQLLASLIQSVYVFAYIH